MNIKSTSCLHHVYIISTPPGGRAALACPTLRCGPVPMRVTEEVLLYAKPLMLGGFNMVQTIDTHKYNHTYICLFIIIGPWDLGLSFTYYIYIYSTSRLYIYIYIYTSEI